MTEAKAEDKKYNIRECARCGQDHNGIVYNEFTNPVILGDLVITHWVPCPTNGEPILMFHPKEGEEAIGKPIEEDTNIHLFKDGDQWCALLGIDLQEGKAAFDKGIKEALDKLLSSLVLTPTGEKYYGLEEAKRIRAEEEIGRLADFFLKNYPDDIGVGDPAHGESAVDMAIRLLTKTTIELRNLAVVKDPPNPHCVIESVEDKESIQGDRLRDPKVFPRLAPGAKNTCALADPENWPCQWALPNIGPVSGTTRKGSYCPKTCDKIQTMKDGEAWSS